MPRYYYFPILLICVFAVIISYTASLARDIEGCLTCHQYPGLVQRHKSGDLKILHIDEERFAKSPHGKFTCRKCHTKIDKIPHTGETGVQCNSECHLTEKDQHLLKNYDFSKLHQGEQFYIAKLHDPSSCRTCHPLYPHSENKLVRALLNMHTGFMYCEACHLKRDSFGPLSYEWASSSYVKFVGKPFGTRFNPLAIEAKELENYLSRILVYELKKDAKESLINIWDTHKARFFLCSEELRTEEEEKKQLNYFHKDIAKKEISVACDECHSSNSILDFKQLGFEEKKAGDLISINIKGLVTKYKTFYFPHLFPR